MRCLIILALLAATACNSLSREEYFDTVEESRICGEGDSCTLAGQGPCSCPMPVNASQAELVDGQAAELECDDISFECSPHDNLRCEAGRCISDQSP